jgi:hypothetical protein
LPESCSAIRAAWIGGCPIPISNEYFDSVNREFLIRNRGQEVTIFRTGRKLAIPFKENGDHIYFQALNSDDAGAKVRASYSSTSGNDMVDTISLIDDFQLNHTEEQVRTVNGISKDRTKGEVDIIDSNGKVLYTMCPTQTSLGFEEYKIDIERCKNICCDQILLKCKIRYKDYTKEDLDKEIDIDSIDALEFAAKALYEKSQSNIQGYQQNILIARTHLEIDKEDLETSSIGYEKMREASHPIMVDTKDNYNY